MPGLSFAIEKKNDTAMLEKFGPLLRETEYLADFSTQILHKTEQSILGVTRSFPEYPISVFENDRYQIWMEGKIYNQDASYISNTLLSLCNSIFSNDFSPLSTWLNQTDGEFLVFAHDKENNYWVIFRDLFGRLPIYYSQKDDQLVLSRDLRFVRKLVNPSSMNQTALGQFLLFGYILDNQTFYSGIHKISLGTLLFIDGNSINTSIHHIKDFNYQHKRYRHRHAKKNAAELANIFVTACKNRANVSSQSILKLSGGYDSRTIAAGLKAAGSDFTTCSWVSRNRKNELDLTTAKEVAKLLEVPWSSYVLNNCSAEDIRIAFKIKAGLDLLGFAYPIRNARTLQQKFGNNITVFDGLCGDKFMPDLGPVKPLCTFNALIHAVISKNRIWSLANIEALMGIQQQALVNSVRDVLLKYPEKSLKQKYIHWYIHQRGMSRFFEYEDRGRSFYWLGTPFLNPAFHDYAMNCPDEQKIGRYLYSLMLKELCPDMLKVPYARNNATAPESIAHCADKAFHLKSKGQRWAHAIQKSPNPFRYVCKKLKKLKKGTSQTVPQSKKAQVATNPLMECLQQLSQRPEVLQYFSKSRLDEVLQNHTQYREEALYHLFTVLTLIEEFHGTGLTLDSYQDDDWYLD